MSYIGTEPKDIRSFGRTKFDYTATQGQTAFTGADDDGKVLAFTVGQIEVYVNGILMDDSDFTTTGTGTVTLASAANLNDVINIVSFETNIPDSDYVPASGGTFSGNVTHSGNVTVGGTLGVTGATTLSGNTTVGGTLGVTGNVTHTGTTTANNDIIANKHLRLYTTDDQANQWYVYTNTDDTLRFNYNGAGNDEVVLDTVGRMTVPNQAYGEAEGNNGGLLASFSSGSIINWFSANHTNGGMTFSNSGRFTVPVAGRYLVSALVYYYPSGSHTAYYSLEIKKNGSLEAFKIDDHVESVSGSIDRTVQMTTIVRCAANDYLELGWSSNINASFWRGADHNKFRVLLLG